MSFEGYYQYLCANGHLWTEDVYVGSECPRCVICGSLPAWINLVNTTNGSYDGDERIDGYIEPEIEDEERCEECGSTLEIRYKIPFEHIIDQT